VYNTAFTTVKENVICEDWHGLGKFVCIQVVLLYKFFVDEDSYNTGAK